MKCNLGAPEGKLQVLFSLSTQATVGNLYVGTLAVQPAKYMTALDIRKDKPCQKNPKLSSVTIGGTIAETMLLNRNRPPTVHLWIAVRIRRPTPTTSQVAQPTRTAHLKRARQIPRICQG